MAISPERKEYIYQYAKEKLKRIPLDVPKETYEEIKAYAEGQGRSVNGFIKQAISKSMERDTHSAPQEAAECPQEVLMVSLPPETIKTAQEAAQSVGETVSQFVERAVETQAKRDRSSLAMGINPATGDKLKGEA